MRTRTDLKAGFSTTKLETPVTIERLSLPEIVGCTESLEDRPCFKTGHMVAAILE